MSPIEFLSIGVHLVSVHGAPGFNNTNPGVFVTALVKDEQVVVGTYYNSVRKQTVYAGWTYSFNAYADVTIGLATGYKYPVVPLLAPSLKLPFGPMQARITLLPNPQPKESAIHLSIEYKFQ
jgi:hypothetical protein